jgi:hypothetical protein
MRADSIAVEATGRNASAAAAKLMKKSPEWVWHNLPVVEILKLQPWWPELCARVSGLRHLKPRLHQTLRAFFRNGPRLILQDFFLQMKQKS